jgi:hypothetical protein
MHYMAQPLSFRWDEEFVARIDLVRGDVPRSVFVRRAVEVALGSDESSRRLVAMMRDREKPNSVAETSAAISKVYAKPRPDERPLSRAEMFKRATQR